MQTIQLLRLHSRATSAQTLQPSSGLFSCALDVIHLYKDFLDVREHQNEMDRFIAQTYLKQVIESLIAKASQWLVSPLPAQRERGSRLVELLSENEAAHSPEYKAYRHLLQTVAGEGPVMRLHLQALDLVAAESRKLRTTGRKATITACVLEHLPTADHGYRNRDSLQAYLGMVG